MIISLFNAEVGCEVQLCEICWNIKIPSLYLATISPCVFSRPLTLWEFRRVESVEWSYTCYKQPAATVHLPPPTPQQFPLTTGYCQILFNPTSTADVK